MKEESLHSMVRLRNACNMLSYYWILNYLDILGIWSIIMSLLHDMRSDKERVTCIFGDESMSNVYMERGTFHRASVSLLILFLCLITLAQHLPGAESGHILANSQLILVHRRTGIVCQLWNSTGSFTETVLLFGKVLGIRCGTDKYVKLCIKWGGLIDYKRKQ